MPSHADRPLSHLEAKGQHYASTPATVTRVVAFGGAPKGQQYVRLFMTQHKVDVVDSEGRVVLTDPNEGTCPDSGSHLEGGSWRLYDIARVAAAIAALNDPRRLSCWRADAEVRRNDGVRVVLPNGDRSTGAAGTQRASRRQVRRLGRSRGSSTRRSPTVVQTIRRRRRLMTSAPKRQRPAGEHAGAGTGAKCAVVPANGGRRRRPNRPVGPVRDHVLSGGRARPSRPRVTMAMVARRVPRHGLRQADRRDRARRATSPW